MEMGLLLQVGHDDAEVVVDDLLPCEVHLHLGKGLVDHLLYVCERLCWRRPSPCVPPLVTGVNSTSSYRGQLHGFELLLL